MDSYHLGSVADTFLAPVYLSNQLAHAEPVGYPARSDSIL